MLLKRAKISCGTQQNNTASSNFGFFCYTLDMKKYLVGLGSLMALALTALAQDQSMGETEQMFQNFASVAPFSGVPPKYDGVFRATKFWKLGRDGNPAAQPDMMFATADVRDAGNYNLFRVAFNGTTLKQTRPNQPFYNVMRSPEPFENWNSWYIHFNATQFPKVIAVDTLTDRGFNLAFPSSYKITYSEPVVFGPADAEVLAVATSGARAQHGKFTIYPSLTPQEPSRAIVFGQNVSNPAAPSLIFVKDNYRGIPDQLNGSTVNGYIAYSACNDKVVEFEGGKKYLFMACTVQVRTQTMKFQRP